MDIITYIANIKNERAVSRVAWQLNPVVGAANWQLYMLGANALLTSFSPGIINEKEVEAAIRKAGYKARSFDNIYSI